MRTRLIGMTVLLGGLTLTLAACPPAEERRAAEPEMPDTTAASLWAYLEQVDYQGTWQMWPGKEKLYKGTEPHGMLLTTYVNSTAHEGVTGGLGALANGSIVVKENYMPDSTLAAITIMYKVERYNPEHNDWFWVKRLADGTVEAQGRVAGCQGCHGARKDNDYIFTSSLR